jgi:hypothetical protein
MRRFHLSCAVLLVLACAPAVPAEDAESPASASATFDAERFYRDVRHLVRRHYPDATAHRLGDKIHFESNTRIFIVHEPLKTGEWQDPWEERGPKKGGVYCDVVYRPGRYSGAAAVPQTFDKRYFSLLVLAPYSERFDAHLYVHLKMPAHSEPPAEFREKLTAMLDGFEAYARAD